MAIKIDMLRCFQAVANHGSLAAAATVLGRTPSAISMMLKQFEEHIGAPLFETARKARLTPLGALILTEAQRELGHFDRTIQAIEGLSQAKLGSVPEYDANRLFPHLDETALVDDTADADMRMVLILSGLCSLQRA